jgi:Cd2+/Zn2+-exporting ATPase
MKKIISFAKSELGRILIGLIFFISALITEYMTRHLSFSLYALILYSSALFISGIPVFIDAVRGILRRDLLDEKFLMTIASIGAMFVGEWSEGAAVMIFFLVGEYFEHKAVAKSRKSIRELMNIRPDEACLLKNGKEEIVDADEVEIGSVIVIRAGERIPIDSIVLSGNADVDTSALTGEAIPRAVKSGDLIDGGAVVINGVLTARTLRVADESAAARILELVENANERKSRAENFITRFSHYYTPTVVILALLLAVLPPIFKLIPLTVSIYRALIFLVISCPCALVISVPMAFFGGIGGAAHQGILYKGGNTFSALARADVFAFDKTGTLTSGEFTVSSVHPIGVSSDELLYLAASAEYGSNHPIATCIKNAVKNKAAPTDVTELAGKGIASTVNSRRILVGNKLLLQENSVEVIESAIPKGAVFVASDGKYIGHIVIADKIKAEAKSAISTLRKNGVRKTVMLSGDRRDVAEQVGRELCIDEVYSELLPENKFEKLEKLINNSNGTVYVGDGINDAPAIALADVGVAMGGIGSDSAIEAADVVIMSDNLEKLPTAVKIARKTIRISTENIVFALGVKALILLLGALGMANMWLAVFADVGVAALAILNSMRTLSVREYKGLGK